MEGYLPKYFFPPSALLCGRRAVETCQHHRTRWAISCFVLLLLLLQNIRAVDWRGLSGTSSQSSVCFYLGIVHVPHNEARDLGLQICQTPAAPTIERVNTENTPAKQPMRVRHNKARELGLFAKPQPRLPSV